MLLTLMEVTFLAIYLHVIATNVQVCFTLDTDQHTEEEIVALPRPPPTRARQDQAVFAFKQSVSSTFFYKVVREGSNYRILAGYFLFKESKYVYVSNSSDYFVFNEILRGK